MASPSSISSSSFSGSITQTSTTSSSSATSTSSSGGLSSTFSSKGAEYFFGFLVTFVVLLSLFICCGLSTRRRLQAQRRGLLDWDWDSDDVVQSEPPALFEPRFVTSGNDNWLSIQPLSSQTVSSSIDFTLTSPSLPPVRRPSRNPQAIHGLSLPTWTAAATQALSTSVGVGQKELKGHGAVEKHDTTTIQIAVLIAMPCRPRTGTRISDATEIDLEDDRPRLLEIGVACENWDSDSNIYMPKGDPA